MYEALARRIQSAVVEACWSQWSTLVGDAVDSGGPSVIDPEALVLASLAMREHERRLTDRVGWWAATGSKLLSVQRMNSVASKFPPGAVDSGLAWFAGQAVRAGDARWKKLALGAAVDESARLGKGPAVPNLMCPSTLMLSMRAGFGVGVKADLVSYLMCTSEESRHLAPDPIVSQLARVLCYSVPSLRRAASEMLLGRFISGTPGRSSKLSIDQESWAQAINLYDPRIGSPANGPRFAFEYPSWSYWAQNFAFLIASIEWARDARTPGCDDVVAASRTRDLVESAGESLRWSGVEVPDARHYSGARYLEAFEYCVSSLIDFVKTD